jgi:hypothetical protein
MPAPPTLLIGHGCRTKRPTWKILEQLPPEQATFKEVVPEPAVSPPPEETAYLWRAVKMVKNSFGV